jgi:hypothetical protein
MLLTAEQQELVEPYRLQYEAANAAAGTAATPVRGAGNGAAAAAAAQKQRAGLAGVRALTEQEINDRGGMVSKERRKGPTNPHPSCVCQRSERQEPNRRMWMRTCHCHC